MHCTLLAKLAESAIESHIGLRANLCGKCLLEMKLSARDKKKAVGLKGYTRPRHYDDKWWLRGRVAPFIVYTYLQL